MTAVIVRLPVVPVFAPRVSVELAAANVRLWAALPFPNVNDAATAFVLAGIVTVTAVVTVLGMAASSVANGTCPHVQLAAFVQLALPPVQLHVPVVMLNALLVAPVRPEEVAESV